MLLSQQHVVLCIQVLHTCSAESPPPVLAAHDSKVEAKKASVEASKARIVAILETGQANAGGTPAPVSAESQGELLNRTPGCGQALSMCTLNPRSADALRQANRQQCGAVLADHHGECVRHLKRLPGRLSGRRLPPRT